MRVAYLSADFGVPVFGTKGASVHVRELAGAMRSLGHDVLIVTPRAGGSPPEGFDVAVSELPLAVPAWLPARRELRALAYARLLRRRARPILRDFAPDVVYERYSLFATAGGELARELGVPHIVEVNAPLAEEQARHRGLALRRTAARLERAILCSADRVIAVSSELESWLLRIGVDGSNVVVLANGVDPERFRPRPADGVSLRRSLGLDGRPVVGFLGTLKPWHDVPTLVKAIGLLRSEREAPSLLLVGEGPERARLAALAAEEGVSATFTGAVPYERVPAYLAALDIAVAPYARDGFYFSPLKLAEYLAAERPVVAADVGQIGHCVRTDETGMLYPPGDAVALAAALRALLADPARAAALGRAGREHVRGSHTWQANACAVVELAQAAGAGGGGRGR